MTWRRADIIGARADDPVVLALLHHVGAPAGDPRADEDGGEQLGRDPHVVIGAGVEEVGVGKELFLFPHHLLRLAGDAIEAVIPHRFGQFG